MSDRFRATYGPAAVNTTTASILGSTIAVSTGGSNATLTGMSVTVDCPGVGAVYAVEIDAAVEVGSDSTNVVEMLVDGVAQAGLIRTKSPVSGVTIMATGHRKWLVTGLSTTTHTFTARSRMVAGSNGANVLATDTVMTVSRMV